MEKAIANALSDYGELPTKWVLAAESMGPDGTNGIWCFTSDRIAAWDALGLLEYARFCELQAMNSHPE